MNRRFDVVVFGAAGYTGKLVAEHFLNVYGASGGLKWAMAGRDRAKLEKARNEIGAPADLPLVIADASDERSLQAMCAETKVVATTVGPYSLYGTPLVAACAEEGTDYVDITGESLWIREMLRYESRAKASGARIVFSCGFDSIPFELGVFVLQKAAEKKLGAPLARVRGRVRRIHAGARGGGVSGGSLATMKNIMGEMQKNPGLAVLMGDPFALTPGFKGPEQPDGNTPYEDKVTGSWVGPFFMAAINTKAVHRCNYLLGHAWGTGFQYDEMAIVDGPPGSGSQPNPLADPNMPKPGEGPAKADREGGCYELVFIGEVAGGGTLRTTVTSVYDAAADSTSRLMAESAVCLVKDISRDTTPGGLWTAASAMGERLVARLEAQGGLTFKTESFR